jgi:hypothetical protein
MPDVFMYANETANLDYQEHQGASTYFCVGTAAFSGNHGEALGGVSRYGPIWRPQA